MKTRSPGVIEAAAMFLGMLAAVVLLSLNSARMKSRDAKRIADIRQMASALELYYNDKVQYPEKASMLQPVYIGIIPTAPTPADGKCTVSQNQYVYQRTAFNNYSLSFCLGQAADGYAAGIHALSPKGIE